MRHRSSKRAREHRGRKLPQKGAAAHDGVSRTVSGNRKVDGAMLASDQYSERVVNGFILLVFMGAMMHHTEDWSKMKKWKPGIVTVVAMLIPLCTRFHAVTTILGFCPLLLMFLRSWPALANHSNVLLLIILTIIASLFEEFAFFFVSPSSSSPSFACRLKRARSLEGLRRVCVGSLAVVYAWAGMHKFNSAFFDPLHSCVIKFLRKPIERAGLHPAWLDLVPESILIASAGLIILIEISAGLLLLHPAYARTGVKLALSLHFFLSPVGFYDFSAIATSVLYIVVTTSPSSSSRRRSAAGVPKEEDYKTERTTMTSSKGISENDYLLLLPKSLVIFDVDFCVDCRAVIFACSNTAMAFIALFSPIAFSSITTNLQLFQYSVEQLRGHVLNISTIWLLFAPSLRVLPFPHPCPSLQSSSEKTDNSTTAKSKNRKPPPLMLSDNYFYHGFFSFREQPPSKAAAKTKPPPPPNPPSPTPPPPSSPSSSSSSQLHFRLHCFVVATVFLFGLSPYIGLRTAGCFSMFSNLRTEGPYHPSNHLLIPSALTSLFSIQGDMVTIISSSRWHVLHKAPAPPKLGVTLNEEEEEEEEEEEGEALSKNTRRKTFFVVSGIDDRPIITSRSSMRGMSTSVMFRKKGPGLSSRTRDIYRVFRNTGNNFLAPPPKGGPQSPRYYVYHGTLPKGSEPYLFPVQRGGEYVLLEPGVWNPRLLASQQRLSSDEVVLASGSILIRESRRRREGTGAGGGMKESGLDGMTAVNSNNVIDDYTDALWEPLYTFPPFPSSTSPDEEESWRQPPLCDVGGGGALGAGGRPEDQEEQEDDYCRNVLSWPSEQHSVYQMVPRPTFDSMLYKLRFKSHRKKKKKEKVEALAGTSGTKHGASYTSSPVYMKVAYEGRLVESFHILEEPEFRQPKYPLLMWLMYFRAGHFEDPVSRCVW
eukprot:jgi/Bigna1/81169/fgenesh1_pg.78_\